MHIFVDYENVHENGLYGVENLTRGDTLTIYYSGDLKISLDVMSRIVAGKFKCMFYKLQMSLKKLNKKSAEDIVILADIDRAKNDGTEYIIVSKDHDFDASIKDFCEEGKKAFRYNYIGEHFGLSKELTDMIESNMEKPIALNPVVSEPEPTKSTRKKKMQKVSNGVDEKEIDKLFKSSLKDYNSQKEQIKQIVLTSKSRAEVNDLLIKLLKSKKGAAVYKTVKPYLKKL